MRGRVHIFKYLEGMANKDTTLSNHRRVDETKRSTKHNSYIASSPNHTAHQITSGNATIDCLRHRPRHVVDSGYSTDGVDKRWCNDGWGEAGGGGSGRSTPSTPSTLSPGTALSRAHSLSSDSPLAPLTPLLSGLRISPEGNVSNGDDKSKVTHQQTYRQYKEALRQQRQQDIYKPRADQSSPDVDTSPQSQNQSPVHLQRNPQSSPHSPVANGYASNVSPSIYNRTLSSNSSVSSSNSTPNTSQVPNSPLLHSTPRRYQNFNQPQTNGNITSEAKPDEIQNRRPVQKVVPSRNVNKTYNTSPILNGNLDYQSRVNGTETYVKPTSPTKSPTSTLSSLSGNTRIARREPISGGEANGAKLLTTTVSYLKGASIKPPGGTGKLSWNKDAAPEKLSFTMKREFDKQKEESDLLQQLRTIIETRLKMNLPSDLAPVLADGVVLCHLANHVRPRSVASVHVPSPAQPKLTMARCRRNVDNFLDACRRIGVEEEDVCSPEDILSYHSDYEGERVRDTGPLANTLAALLAHVTPAKENRATFEQNNYHIQDANFVDSDSMIYHKQFRNRYTDDRSIGSFNYVDNTYTIDEAEEYEINENEYQNIHYSPVYNEGIRNRGYYQYNRVQFVTPFCQKDGVLKSESLEIYDTDEVDFHSVERNREVNYDRSRMNLEIQNNLNRELAVEVSALKEEENRKLMCCAADVLEGKGTVQVAITVSELVRRQAARASPALAPTSASAPTHAHA
ncbi:Leucine-rich repeat and calponin homology domain-containing protein 1 [Eumeta japonica]|uniref:Leucine-rich repeat and calponin homology domain-containing protein 1 n=1 Tax=Eumeta variegata TaxID=151549 RepID=A0A4C1UY27_EUMVA|nr:Leucine-rich repeat and calponin homology domain-containing protein 1 [Eumeta japonica]